ncbi:MAG TPA: hypothetical protein VH183_15080 [Burkholderiaceae bacterium]|jgi:hypothetical protein|nr:hypothetical protein [Burkholderiaceae bacterium]
MARRPPVILLVCALAAAHASLAQSLEIKLPGTGTFILPVDAGRSLLKQCSRDTPANVSQFWNPSAQQIEKLESLLPKYVRDGANPRSSIPGNVEYHRQYVGIVVNGKRLIYGNFYPADVLYPTSVFDHFDEKSTPVVVCDGGPVFWGVVFDPESNAFLDLRVNGSV